ncbi:hypothetical protein Vretifemale_14740 [Volvox reticuliferus]|uniref:F-box domain-containing protein n=1 Tax=Volvox reticuliferus TaxID=1737510 RepID=A0A8J4CQA0_9CHLO|nr:hypothetical protein Vretifemale_14740 [Volvox reticuliferus]
MGLGPSTSMEQAIAVTPDSVELTQLPEPFMFQLLKRLSQEDVKSLRLVCSRLCTISNGANRLSSLKASALLTDAAPTLARLPPISFLDFNARNAACSHQLLAALRQHGSRLEHSVRAVRLSGRDGLLAALQTLRLACPRIERLEIRCQHSYRGRHKECADLGRCLQELEAGFPSLTELHLQRFPISSAQLVHMCDSLLGLRALSIRGLTHALINKSLAHLHRLSQLVSLSVDHLNLQDGCLPCGLQLRELELSDAIISARSFASLNALAGLQLLSIWGTGHRAALGFSPLTGLTALRRLHLELVLDATVLEGLQGCTALTSLSAAGARVLSGMAADGAEASRDGAVEGWRIGRDGSHIHGMANRLLPPQLSSVTRLSLEAWSEDCRPLAAWLPGLRSLVLQDGGGMWSAVAGHEQLTSLRAAEGGSLPPAAAMATGPCAARYEVTAAASRGKELGIDTRCTGHLHHQVHQPHHHYNHMHHLGPEGSSGDSHGTSSGSGVSSDSRSGGSSGGIQFDGSSKCSSSITRPASDADTRSVDRQPGGNSVEAGRDGEGVTPHVASGSRVYNKAPFNPEGEAEGEAAPQGRSRTANAAQSEFSGCKDGGSVDGSNLGSGEACWQPPPPQLASLRLGGCQDLPEQHYFSCAPIPTLTACHLSGCGGLTTPALVWLLSAMPRLHELALEGAPFVTDQGLVLLGGRGSDRGGRRVVDGHEREGDDGLDVQNGSAGGGVVVAEAGIGVTVAAAPLRVVCAPAMAAATKAAAMATGVPVPPCSACACMAEAVVPALSVGAAAAIPVSPQAGGPSGMLRSSSAAALAAAAAMEQQDAAAIAVKTTAMSMQPEQSTGGTEAVLRRLELTRLSGITARGVAAAAACLPRLTELRVSREQLAAEACGLYMIA